MKAVRRIYIYLVAFVSLEVVAWSVIGLGRSAFDRQIIGGGADQLAGALAFILVGLPVFLIHWLLAQRDAGKESEERFSGMRVLFLYGTWLVLFIPVVQNVTAMLNRALALWLASNPKMIAIGSDQTWSDNLVGIAVNGVLAAYFYTVIRDNWMDMPKGNWFPLIQRIARYLLMLYGFAMAFAGVQQVLYYLFELGDAIGSGIVGILVNGLTFLLIGVPLWTVLWRLIQRSLEDKEERESLLRMGVLYGLTFLAVVITIVSGGSVLNEFFRAAFRATSSTGSFIGRVSGELSVLIPALVSWVFYNQALKRGMEATSDIQQRAGMHRLYAYVLSLMGLVASFVGTYLLIEFTLDLLESPQIIRGETWHLRNLAEALSTLLVGLPVWVLAWRQMTAEASQKGEAGDHARRSVIRKGYLYIILFAGVMGIMGTTGTLLYNILKLVLGDDVPDFTRMVWDLSSLLVLFVVLAVYHWRSLRRDNQIAADALSALHAKFSVCVFDQGDDEFAKSVVTALANECPNMPVTVHQVGEAFDKSLMNAGAAILPASLAIDQPEPFREWLEEFPGHRLFVPTETEGWNWVGFSGTSQEDLAREVANTACRLAEGQRGTGWRGVSGWKIAGYVFAFIVGFFFLFSLILALIDLF